MLHIIWVLWIPGNVKDSSLKGQEAASCPQAHSFACWEGWLQHRGLWLRAPQHVSSSGPSHQGFSGSRTSSQSRRVPLPTRLAKFYSDTTFSIKSYVISLAITSDRHLWLLTQMLWVSPHWRLSAPGGQGPRHSEPCLLQMTQQSILCTARSNKCLMN